MKTRVTNFLGIRCPVIQGGMAWVADYHLAAAVSEAGRSWDDRSRRRIRRMGTGADPGSKKADRPSIWSESDADESGSRFDRKDP